MKIIQTRAAPNPRRVRIFLAEKGIDVAFEERDLMASELKTEAFQKLNPMQRVPVLVLADGTAISESIAICRYFEEIQPDPPMFGTTPVDKAIVEMWQRRIEWGLLLAIAHVLRHLNPKMAHLEVPQVPEWGEANKPKVMEMLKIINDQLADTRFIAGETFSVADITALVAIDFLKPARLTVADDFEHVHRWYRDVAARPSASA